MFSRIWLINLALAVCVVFVGVKTYGVWSKGHDPAGLMGQSDASRTKPAQEPIPQVETRRLPPEKSFEIVVSKNLFTPGRTNATVEDAGGPGPEPVAKAEAEKSLKGMSLYGVIMADGYQKALVMDKAGKKAPPRAKTPAAQAPPQPPGQAAAQTGAQGETVWVKVGDVIGDFRVASIAQEKITLETGGTTYDLLLHDKENPKTRAPVKTASVPPVVVQAGDKPKTAGHQAAPVPAKPVSAPAASQPGGGVQVPAVAQPSTTPAHPQETSHGGGQPRQPFQPASSGKTAATAPPPQAPVSDAKDVNPFLKALQNQGVLPNK